MVSVAHQVRYPAALLPKKGPGVQNAGWYHGSTGIIVGRRSHRNAGIVAQQESGLASLSLRGDADFEDTQVSKRNKYRSWQKYHS